MDDLPPHRKPVPYDDPAKARAYRAGYEAWPNGQFGTGWHYRQVSAWLEGWSDARRDDCPLAPEEGPEKVPARWRAEVNLRAFDEILVFFGYAGQDPPCAEEGSGATEHKGWAGLPAEEVEGLLGEIETLVRRSRTG